ncbi:MAG: radical SAM protein [Patescibacteria group bacterium]
MVLQAGVLSFPDAKEYFLAIVRSIRERFPEMGITLSLGEQDQPFLRELKEAGAHRYLLRIETSVPRLYRRLHPANHSLARRKKCLRDLRGLGYQVGCGNMIGLPGQTLDDMVDDLLFFRDGDFDMFGLGPYVIHRDTPLATPRTVAWWEERREEIFQRTLNVIALLRILMPTCNIAAATALDVFHKDGREQALRAGANVLMPSVTPSAYRHAYLLYQRKPCLDGDAERCGRCIVRKAERANLRPALGVQGTSLHFLHRTHG